MKEKPILFSTDMVRAILDGRKTVTRRMIKNADPFIRDNGLHDSDTLAKCPYSVGDTLWVRETWCYADGDMGQCVHAAGLSQDDFVSLFPSKTTTLEIKWKPSIHMKREHARLFLCVTDVRAERLQDITEEDAVAEGVIEVQGARERWGFPMYQGVAKGNICQINKTAVEAFSNLCDSIYAKRGMGWNANPWVWRVKFEKI